MIKSEIFASVLKDVCEVTEIPEQKILSKSKEEDIVDARHLLIVTLVKSGYYPKMIAERLHITGRAVRYVLSAFHTRAANSPGLALCRKKVETKRNIRGEQRDVII